MHKIIDFHSDEESRWSDFEFCVWPTHLFF
jgi:hypothetical protein